MASLRTHKKSKYWYACICGPDGKQKQFSTGLENKTEALAVAVATERALRKHRDKPHQLRAALDRLMVDYVPEADPDPSAWLEKWVTSRLGEVAATTGAAYVATIKETAEWLRAQDLVRFSAVTPQRLGELRDYWGANQSAGTANLKMKILKIAFGQARKQKLIADNVAAEVPALRKAATARREFRPEELAVLLPALKGEWRGMVFLGLYTGQRLNDLAVLSWRNVNLMEGTIAFTAAKTGAVVALPLMDAAKEALLALPGRANPDGLLFPGIAKIHKAARSNAFRKILSSVGLARHPHAERTSKTGSREVSELCFHSLRHTATSMLKAAGVSDAIARAIVGHESAAVSRVYTHLDMETMRAAMQKMPGA
jgi:integrase